MYSLIIVEDEDIIRSGLQGTIDWESMGFRLTGIARDGYEGLKLAKSQCPDVVLTDIKMPEYDGIRLIKEIKQFNPNIEVVFLSGYADFEYARQAVQYDAYAYILKMDLFTQLDQVFAGLRQHLDRVNESKMEINQLKTVSFNQALIQAIREKNWKLPGISGKYFCAIVIGNGWKLIKDTVVTLSSKGNLVSGEYAGNGIILFYSDAEDYLKQNIQLFFARLAHKFEGVSMIAASGSIVHERSDVTNSYYEAMKMLDYGTLEDKDGVCIYAYDKTNLDPPQSNEHWQSDNLAQWILQGMYDEFLKNYSRFIKNAIYGRGITIYNVRTHLLGIFNKLSVIYGSTIFEDRYSEYAASICRHDSILQICKWLEEKLPEIGGAVNSYRAANGGSMQAVLKYVDKNFNMDIKMEDVAKYFFMSPPYFCTQFKKHTGMNFTCYVKMRRMERAYQIISSTDMKISLISKEVGYEDEKHFSKLFKEKYGVSPAQCRNNRNLNTENSLIAGK